MNSLLRMMVRSAVCLSICLQWESMASAQSIGSNMVSYLNNQLNTRVGGGRSGHMATEALRVAGGEFVPSDLGADSPSDGDKVWGTLVTVISNSNGSWSDSNPTSLCQPGDVIQIGSAVFGTTSYPLHFTCVVAAVNANGRPSSIFQQNFQQNRTVQQADIDTTQLTDGWLRIYRPQQRIDRFNEWKFTVVNNSASNQSYDMMDSVFVDSTINLTATNTSGSYYVHLVTTIGTVPNYYLLTNQLSYFVQTAKANEIYDSPDGPAIRQLDQ